MVAISVFTRLVFLTFALTARKQPFVSILIPLILLSFGCSLL